MSTPRERVIKILNRDFGWLIGCEIPLNQPIKSHQTKYASAGGYRWYFTCNREYSNCINQGRISAFGSTETMTELLKKNREWVVIKEDSNCYDIQLKELYENELHLDDVFQKRLT